jgi:small subunit ribosomal protein S16
MVKLRLARFGGKKDAFYRIVAADSRMPRDGRCLEQLGWYDPMVDTNSLKLNLERIDHWLSKGAQPSDTVRALITKFRGAAESAGAEA